MNKNKENMYQIKFIKTKSKHRKILTYKTLDAYNLRKKHEKINSFLKGNIRDSKFAYAYIEGRSIFDNAKVHLYNDYFIKLDIKNFFQSINHKKLRDILYYELNKHVEISKYEVGKIVNLCSVYEKGLPLGLVTSPILANIYLKEFDSILYGRLKKFNFSEESPIKQLLYTRYADDLIISFKKNYDKVDTIKISNQITELVKDLLSKYNLFLNDKKETIINIQEKKHIKITGVSIVLKENNFRILSVGRKRVRLLYNEAVSIYKDFKNDETVLPNKYRIERVKGNEAFILSIEKNGYDNVYSSGMKEYLKSQGFGNLSALISFLSKLTK